MSSLFVKNSFGIALLVLASLVLVGFSQVAEAKRLGSGKSMGYQKEVAPKSFNTQKDTSKAAPSTQPAGAAAAGTAAAGTAAKSGASKWLGPLAGLAAGGLLAAMLFGDGFENFQILDFLLFALIAFVLFKLFMSRKRASQQEPAYSGYEQPAQHSRHPAPEAETVMQRESSQPVSELKTANAAQPAYNPNSGGSIFGADLDEPVGQAPSENAEKLEQAPAWFDAQGFVEGAKGHFTQMQAAWDQVDLEKLAGYCTPELFAALKEDLAGAVPGQNQTVVDELHAEIVQMAIEDNYFIASIRYSGFIDEDNEGAHAFTEVWHIRRLAEGEGSWQVAGIQQAN